MTPPCTPYSRMLVLCCVEGCQSGILDTKISTKGLCDLSHTYCPDHFTQLMATIQAKKEQP
jgi:hypothetical protein